MTLFFWLQLYHVFCSVITFPGLLITMVTCIRIMSVLGSNKKYSSYSSSG